MGTVFVFLAHLNKKTHPAVSTPIQVNLGVSNATPCISGRVCLHPLVRTMIHRKANDDVWSCRWQGNGALPLFNYVASNSVIYFQNHFYLSVYCRCLLPFDSSFIHLFDS
ncbi:hypothetical protein AAZX31_09G173900 [Glycine max]